VRFTQHEHDKLNPPDDIREQTRLVMENLQKCLYAGGATFPDVVQIDVFLTDMEDQDVIGEVMENYFKGDYPAGIMVEVKRLVDKRLKLEISAIAVT